MNKLDDLGKLLKKAPVDLDMEHLKKLFIMPDSPDKFVEFGTELLDVIHSFFQEDGGIHSSISLNDLSKLFSDINIPSESQLLKNVLFEIKDKIVSNSVKVASPYYIGHMTSVIPYFMILLEMIIASINQNQIKIETAKASTFVERELISWMHKLVFKKPDKYYKNNIQNRNVALGNVTLDGTLANLTAMKVARNKAFAARGDFSGVRRAGLYEAYRYYGCSRAVIIVSKRGHYSFEKISRILGIGDSNVIKIPIDSHNRMDIDKLETKCMEIQNHNLKNPSNKIKIISIVGIAGTTETGNIDNLAEIGRIAKKNKTHFHVDAAWGGSLLLVEEYRYLFNGIELADSVTIDAHKLLYAPTSMGMVLFKSRNDLNHIRHTSNYIIRPDSIDLGRFTIEGSRPFSALKVWTILKVFGIAGFSMLFEHAFDITCVLRGIVERHNNFEPMNKPEIFIFNYRFVPEKVQRYLGLILKRIESKSRIDVHDEIFKLNTINEMLNDLNIEVHKTIREEDTSFVSRTMLDSPRYLSQDIVVLRAITINPLTTPEILKEIIDAQNRIGEKVYKTDFMSKFKKVMDK